MLPLIYRKINLNKLYIIGLAYLIRVSVSSFGNNYDFDSYKFVVLALQNGITPWETYRYNYGISWAFLLFILEFLSMGNEIFFRYLIILVLTLADIYIAYIIWIKFGKKFALIFLFNPVSIIITGYYNQFDNLALAIGLAAIVNMEKKGNQFKSFALLFLSLITKHNLLLFLFWIFISKRLQREKYFLATFPILAFFVHFLPFIFVSREVRDAVLSNVFMYWSNNNAPLWQLLVRNKELIESLSNNNLWHHGRVWMLLFFVSVSIFGFFRSQKCIINNFFAYTLALVFFSSAITSQFFAIAAIGASSFYNPAFLTFFIFGMVWLVTEPSGLEIDIFVPLINYVNFDGWRDLPLLLLPGLLFHFIKTKRHFALRSHVARISIIKNVFSRKH